MALVISFHRLYRYSAAGRRLLSVSHGRPLFQLAPVTASAARSSATSNTSGTIDRHWFSSSGSVDENETRTSRNNQPPTLLYEGPFAQLSLRLKRVSITTAALGVVGMPLLMALHGGDVPATGQLAVGGTAIMAAAGSTVALSFCFSPYVHKLERVVVPSGQAENKEGEENGIDYVEQKHLVKATTANILGMRVETIFDPATDVGKALGSRPFCNFTAKGLPMYVHPEMVYDDELRLQLIGQADLELHEKAKEAAAKNKHEDDEFL